MIFEDIRLFVVARENLDFDLILLLLNTTSGGSNQGLTRQFKLVPDRIGKYSIKQ